MVVFIFYILQMGEICEGGGGLSFILIVDNSRFTCAFVMISGTIRGFA